MNVQNIYDNECFKWCLVRYLQVLQPIIQQELQKLTKIFQKDLILKTKSPVRTREIYKLEKQEFNWH